LRGGGCGVAWGVIVADGVLGRDHGCCLSHLALGWECICWAGVQHPDQRPAGQESCLAFLVRHLPLERCEHFERSGLDGGRRSARGDPLGPAVSVSSASGVKWSQVRPPNTAIGGIVTEQPPTGVTELAAARTRKSAAPAINRDLRAWAKGVHTSSAAVELLIRGFGGRFAAPGQPWIQPREHVGHWADLEAIPGNIGALPGGERAYLLITASIGLGGSDGPAINLGDTISALGREQLTLVLAAIAHANGSHQSSGIEIDPVTGTPSLTQHASLYPWPE